MNNLVKLNEFRKIIASYSPPKEVESSILDIDFVVLTGPSASGRNTIINKILESNKYYFVVSDTTRKPRINNGVIEENGEVYWFKSEQQFLDGLKAGQYIESAIIHEQQVSGINISELLKASQQHKTAITDVEPQGVASIIKIKPNTKTIFVIPPTFKEWLVRIDNRGILSPSEKKRRLQSMIIEINQGLLVDYYHFVVNGELDQAVIEIKDYIEDNHFDPIQEQENRQKARELSESAKSYLLKS